MGWELQIILNENTKFTIPGTSHYVLKLFERVATCNFCVYLSLAKFSQRMYFLTSWRILKHEPVSNERYDHNVFWNIIWKNGNFSKILHFLIINLIINCKQVPKFIRTFFFTKKVICIASEILTCQSVFL